MNIPPSLIFLLVPAALVGAWLFLHKDADIEQRIEKREAIHQRESANFDKDFARMSGDAAGVQQAQQRAQEADAKLANIEQQNAARAAGDQRAAVRDSVDELLKPEPTGEKK